MPEPKEVPIASVGVCTIALPRRLNDVFTMTDTPVRFPGLKRESAEDAYFLC